MDPDAARPGIDLDQRSTAADLAHHMVMIHGPLSGHLTIRLDAAGPGLGVERQSSVAGPQFNAT